ncbi:MAG: WD40 repeat domain-containing protein [Saprospiraceae bacterium]|nr:WD40 repeat domain-containing protein [Saprospiraceae bacterium]
MRIRFVGLIFLAGFRLFAQEQKTPFYIQQAQVQLPLDCYQHKLEAGVSAQQNGDFRKAIDWFEEALSCPEALNTPERLEKLNSLIAQSKTALQPRSPQRSPKLASGSETRRTRHFQPSRAFLLYDKPACFDITCQEAERAYQGGFWDDAAALFRAAKNCHDTDQADRKAANQRIEACRLAADNELRQKEQEAVRQARHALAANRANDAQRLLRDLDRSLAYRLADFANEFIAPDDNDACRQAMFDALYYTPSEHSELADERLHIPFCYQLGDNLDSDLEVTFSNSSKGNSIYAFARSRHLLFEWDASSFQPKEPVFLEDTTFLSMTVVPDGRTLLFFSKNAFVFWRAGTSNFRLPVQAVAPYCFSPNGREFFYLNPEDMRVYRLNLRDAFAQGKGYGSRAAARAVAPEIGYGLLGMAYQEDKLWLGYRDSIVILGRPGSGSNFVQEQIIRLDYQDSAQNTGNQPYMYLQPAYKSAILATDSEVLLFRVPEVNTGAVQPERQLSGTPVAISRDMSRIATQQLSLFDLDSRLVIYNAHNGQVEYNALLRNEQANAQLSNGVFSPDGGLLATTTTSGKLEIWELRDGANQSRRQLAPSGFMDFNTDGQYLFSWQTDSLVLLDTKAPETIVQAASIPAATTTYLKAGQNWVAYRTGMEEVVVTDQIGKAKWQFNSPAGYYGDLLVDFSADDAYVAYLASEDTVALRSLSDGQLVASRAFGNAILQLHMVPGTNEIMIVQLADPEHLAAERTVVKLWSPASDQVLTLRLHDYTTREVAFSAQTGMMAFTDGIDIRVFHQNDLLDESIRIRQYETHMVTAMSFDPDGEKLAAGYDDGSVVFWDLNTGLARFTWAKPVSSEENNFPEVRRLRFTPDGRRLHILLSGNILLTRDVDLALIRSGLQTPFKKLVAFSPNQIRDYNLEQALDYPNNFTRLAASDDLPLIRSFFDYYREAAINGNNIQRISNYCQRASILFDQIDKATQAMLRPILLEMYEDYHWKLLLRNRVADAEKVRAVLKRNAVNPLVTIQAEAFSALLRNDQRTAVRLFADWTLRTADQASVTGVLQTGPLDSLQYKIRQLLEYDLIQASQLSGFCDLFGSFPVFGSVCTDVPEGASMAMLDPVTQLRWAVFIQLNAAPEVKNHPRRIQMLEQALGTARQLQRQNPAFYKNSVEKITLALAQGYADWGYFEAGQAAALLHYEQAIRQLEGPGTFTTPARERQRLADLSMRYLELTQLHLNAERLSEAGQAVQQGLQVAQRLLQQVGADSALYYNINNEIVSNLYIKSGMIHLMKGDTGGSQQAFTQANEASSSGIFGLYTGHAALLAGDTLDAYLQYGDIYDDESLGQALFELERMAALLPARRSFLLRQAEMVREARLATRETIDPLGVAYSKALLYIQLYRSVQQWDSAYRWSTVALGHATAGLSQKNYNSFDWPYRWLDSHLNQSYYLLYVSKNDPSLLSKAIQDITAAQVALDSISSILPNRPLLQTNLAHAYWLRQQAGDREKALEAYRNFLQSGYSENDPWEVLLKDFRDLTRAGVHWPDLKALLADIKPADAQILPEEWRELGIPPPNE